MSPRAYPVPIPGAPDIDERRARRAHFSLGEGRSSQSPSSSSSSGVSSTLSSRRPSTSSSPELLFAMELELRSEGSLSSNSSGRGSPAAPPFPLPHLRSSYTIPACVLCHRALTDRDVQQRERMCSFCRTSRTLQMPSSSMNAPQQHLTNGTGHRFVREPSDDSAMPYMMRVGLGRHVGRPFPAARTGPSSGVLPAGIVPGMLPNVPMELGAPHAPIPPAFLRRERWQNTATQSSEQTSQVHQRIGRMLDSPSNSSPRRRASRR